MHIFVMNKSNLFICIKVHTYKNAFVCMPILIHVLTLALIGVALSGNTTFMILFNILCDILPHIRNNWFQIEIYIFICSSKNHIGISRWNSIIWKKKKKTTKFTVINICNFSIIIYYFIFVMYLHTFISNRSIIVLMKTAKENEEYSDLVLCQ